MYSWIFFFEELTRFFNDATVYIFLVINYTILFIVMVLLFAIIFKVLPDAKIRWRDVGVGAAFTAVLFVAGKFLIGFIWAGQMLV